MHIALLASEGFSATQISGVLYCSRTIADQNRRMSNDYERLCASGEALVYATMIRLMTRGLARV